MRESLKLASDQLFRPCDPHQFEFETTAELDDIDIVIGQQRALDSVHFGLSMDASGYNVFALGPPGIGKFTSVCHMVQSEADKRTVPTDWCYVNNFEQPHRPKALQLPAGRGAALRQDMAQLVEDLSGSIPAAFESEDYRARIEELQQELKQRQNETFQKLSDQAQEQGIALLHTSSGFAFAPVSDDGEVLQPEQFAKLAKPEQEQIEAKVEHLQQELQKNIRQFPVWAKEARETVKAFNREIAEFAINHLIDDLQEKYADLADVSAYLATLKQDIIDNFDTFLPQQDTPMPFVGESLHRNQHQRYRVNLLVDNSEATTAPVVFEDLPNYMNLLGRVEHQTQMGALITNFTLIKPGALHRANGGYLILDARQVLLQPLAWDGLKRALRTREMRLDSLERSLGLISTVSLEPEPIPLQIKVVLVGERLLYYLLSEHDPDFNELFKVLADFDEMMDRSPESNQLYARLFATLARKQKLKVLDRTAVARLIEHGSRLAADAEKVSTHLRTITDLLREADYWANSAKHSSITGDDVQTAIDQQIYRAERVRQRSYENIQRGTILIDTSGAAIGQINGLSVLRLGNFDFGQPTRITATTRLGDGKVIDIERETELGGPIHAKGVLILASFLAARYAIHQPLSMAASLVFEQSYGMVEGDSASLAELCALLSSLARMPIQQCYAVTGSVNQHGQVQAIGGVNEKVEGFFDVCLSRELSGQQGVIIPASNVKHLMLRSDVVRAVAEQQFTLYAVTTVDQALSILLGSAAGERDAAGNFPAASVNGRVEARLLELSALRHRFANTEQDDPSKGVAMDDASD